MSKSNEPVKNPFLGLLRLIAVAFGCIATFTGTVFTSYGVYSLIQVFVTDDSKARGIYQGCAPLLLIVGVSTLLMGVMVLRRFRPAPLKTDSQDPREV